MVRGDTTTGRGRLRRLAIRSGEALSSPLVDGNSELLAWCRGKVPDDLVNGAVKGCFDQDDLAKVLYKPFGM